MQIHLIFNAYYPIIFVYQNKSVLNCTRLLTSAASGGTLFPYHFRRTYLVYTLFGKIINLYFYFKISLINQTYYQID